jgi:hypothetical protein
MEDGEGGGPAALIVPLASNVQTGGPSSSVEAPRVCESSIPLGRDLLAVKAQQGYVVGAKSAPVTKRLGAAGGQRRYRNQTARFGAACTTVGLRVGWRPMIFAPGVRPECVTRALSAMHPGSKCSSA